MRPSFRLFHISDLHLASQPPESPSEAGRLAALREAVRYASEHAELLAVVGDLFDSVRVPDVTAEGAARALTASAVPVVVLPGNHDPLLPGTPWNRAPFAVERATMVHILRQPKGETLTLPELGVTLWGRPHAGFANFRPLGRAPRLPPQGWRVALAHGHLVRGPHDHHRSWLVTEEEIDASSFDYVALGHWDAPYEVGTRVPAVYSGAAAPRPARCGSSPGWGVLATLDEGGIELRAVPLDGAGSALRGLSG